MLLSSHLGDPDRRPLTIPQLRTLAQRMQHAAVPTGDRELQVGDLTALGYGLEMARRITALLSGEDLLEYYLEKGRRLGCEPITRVSGAYPLVLRKRLGLDSPGVLWARGEEALLSEPAIALVGSRELKEDNWKFAAEVGRQAALQGYVLVSGNARGADRTAQEACLAAGGAVISVIADELWKQPQRSGMLYLSEDGFAEAFSAQRAISRNRCIHGLGLKTFVAQAALRTGGSWDGTMKNLRNGWSPVFCYADGSEAMSQLCQMGANSVSREALGSIYDLENFEKNLFDR